MLTMRCDSSDVIAKHQAMVRDLLTETRRASENSKDILVKSILDDLDSKIMRPGEQKLKEVNDRLVGNIDGEVWYEGSGIIIGVGNIEKMDANVRYWLLQEEGGAIKVGPVPGFFVDGAGNRVPFDKSRKPVPGATTEDVFIYQPYSGSFMWVDATIPAKHYFRDGDLNARAKVLEAFEEAFRRVFI